MMPSDYSGPWNGPETPKRSMAWRLWNYLRNIVLMPGRVKELHEITIETQGLMLRELRRQRDLTKLALARTAELHVPDSWTGGQVRVVLLVHYPEAWASLEGVYWALEEDDRFAVTVASVPRRFPGADRFAGEDLTHDALTANGVPHIRLNFSDSFESLDVVRALRPHLVFRQSQWDADVPPAFSSKALGFTRLCLVPYETMNLVENVRDEATPTDTAVDAPFHRAAWRVFCANETVRDAAAASNGPLGAERFIVTGHPKAASIGAAAPRWPVAQDGGRRGRIVWSAHHSIGRHWTRFGMFPRMQHEMLDFARSRPDLEFVFMPHPMLPSFVGHADSPIGRGEFGAFLAAWAGLANATTYVGSDYAGVIRAADAVITDGISMLIEPQIAMKPIVFVERDDHRPFNATGRAVVRGVHVHRDVDSAIEAVGRLALGGADPLVEMQRENVRELFAHPDPERRIIDAIIAGLEAEAGGSPTLLAPVTPIDAASA
ncbi:hypothetical protein [Agromyces sp. GXQ0307]|uniref:hypothetical protein n=1 Tax=Agromyces sp. GXQ0307 TaxID=3377835 RepID=UPI00383AE90D